MQLSKRAPIDVVVGGRVRRARKRRGILQVELAETLGVHPMTVGFWERGRERLPGDRREALAKELGVPLGHLSPGEMVEVSPDERDLLEAYRRITSGRGRASIQRIMAAIETARETASC